ncbi:glycosyltransferase [Falsigemmobacter faecalis]|uniref:Glycosyltransferase n=1 Tax=Falsigemmobacter faecalis TaxID=2488730 RepID=A0A3P3DA07_9RHOB|nr:glycosyltransferase [Falsigemmobacter faecalis]RRH71167.1 glycosyltransferase [Falsigemmobacter faecalis]
MRVLFYNWVSPFDPEGRGGGVAAYERALVPALSGAGIEAGWLNSGLAQDLRPGPPRWERCAPGQFRLVNARPFAPSHLSFGDPEQISHPPTEAAFAAFLRATGPWDVIHFNNLEGLPARALQIARAHGARLVVMLHNYYPLCPQVNLWFQERESCASDQGGAACGSCLAHPPAPRRRLSLALATALLERGGPGGLRLYRRGTGLWRALRARRSRPGPGGLAALPASAPPALQGRRALMIRLLNENADAILCVSERVRKLSEGFGLRGDLLKTCRIGTPEAARPPAPPRPLLDASGRLTLAYVGYMRRDKGFFFLLDALEQLPADLAARVSLVLAARLSDPALRPRLQALRARLAGLSWANGYQREDLDRILAPAGLGVVPVLWEDNLPQVALEMHLRGLALLTSDRGGAQEPGNCPALVFPAGDIAAFHSRLRAVLQGQITRADYGQGGAAPADMPSHLRVLMQHWQPAEKQPEVALASGGLKAKTPPLP